MTDSRRRTKPSVVREIRICQEGLRAATVLLSDGSVWWVSDLSVAPWEPVVMIPSTFRSSRRVCRRRTGAVQAGVEESSPSTGFQRAKIAAAEGQAGGHHKNGDVDMETQGDRDKGALMVSCKAGDVPPSDVGVSAVAILVRPWRHLLARNASSSVIGRARKSDGSRDNTSPSPRSTPPACSYPTATDARPKNGHEKRDSIHAIVVGRDDGWMSLLVPPGEEPSASTPPRSPTCRCPRPSSGDQTPQNVRAESEEEYEREVLASAETDVGKDVSRGGGSGSIGRSRRPWQVVASWKGHKCRVTSVWVVQNDDETSRASSIVENASSWVGNPRVGTVEELGVQRSVPPFTAALNTSKLSTGRLPDAVGGDGNECLAVGTVFDGALVSAGSDGTVAWWEWPGFVERGSVSVAEDVSDRMPAPKLRMVGTYGNNNIDFPFHFLDSSASSIRFLDAVGLNVPGPNHLLLHA